MVLHHHHGNVVILDCVGKCDQRAVGGLNVCRLIVVRKVADVFHTCCGQQIRRLKRLRQARAEPANWPLSGKSFKRVHGAFNHRLLIVNFMNRHLLIRMRHKLPACFHAGLCHAWAVNSDSGIDGQGRLDAQRVVQLFKTPKTNAYAVFMPRPVGHIGQ